VIALSLKHSWCTTLVWPFGKYFKKKLILLSMVKKNNIYVFMGRMYKCKTFKAFLTIRLGTPLQDFFSHLSSQFTSFTTLLSKTNLPMYNYFMSGANRCDEKQSQSRLASRFQVFHLLWNIRFGGSCTSCHSPYVHKPPSYAILYLFSRMRFLDSVCSFWFNFCFSSVQYSKYLLSNTTPFA
jgi:hypothetical protein